MRRIAPRTYELDDLEKELYLKIKEGIRVSRTQVNSPDAYALTRLRRNGLIENHGTRSRSIWVLSDNWKQWPYNHITTIILPDGETNPQDSTLVEMDTLIANIEAVLERLKNGRAEYILVINSAIKKIRNNSDWRKFTDVTSQEK